MSETPTPKPQPQILGIISPEEAAFLHGSEVEDPRAQEILQGIGATALSEGGPQYALVVEKDEQGRDVPSHYVDATAHDLGTRVKPKNNEAHGLPEPTEAYAALTADNETSVAPETVEVDTAVQEAGPTEAKEQSPELAELAFSRNNLGNVHRFMQGLQQGILAGVEDGYVRSHLTDAANAFRNDPDNNRAQLLVMSGLASGAMSRSQIKQQVVGLFRDTLKDTCTPDENIHLIEALTGIEGVMNTPGVSVEESTNYVSRIIGSDMDGLAKAESAGKDVTNVRIALAAIGTGAMLASPHMAGQYKDNFMHLLQRYPKSE